MKCLNDYTDIDKKVTMYIDGKHGKIGIIFPDKEPTLEELNEFYKTIVEIALTVAKHNRIEGIKRSF